MGDANLLALDLSGIFNVGTGKETSVNEIFKKIVVGLRKKIEEIHGSAVEGEQMRSCLDSDKLKQKGWIQKYDLDRGLTETIEYFKKKR